jgi:hypothetical protein
LKIAFFLEAKAEFERLFAGRPALDLDNVVDLSRTQSLRQKILRPKNESDD